MSSSSPSASFHLPKGTINCSYPPTPPKPVLKYFCPGDSGFKSLKSLCRHPSLTTDFFFFFSPPPLQISPPFPNGKSLQGGVRTGRGKKAGMKGGPGPLWGVYRQARRLRLPTWRVHFNVKYQLSGIGHHHFPPVRVIAVHIPHRVVHRDSQVPAGY